MSTQTPYEIPLQASAQTFNIYLNGVEYTLLLVWNTPSQCWMLSISDVHNNPILSNIPLVTGGDLLSQFEYLEIGGQLIVQTDNDPAAVPTYTNLGSTGHLYFVVTS